MFLTLPLQRKKSNIFTLNDKIEGFIKKINIWKNSVKNNSLEMFIDIFIVEKNNSKNLITTIIIDHLNATETQFHKHFISNFNLKKLSWIQKPFSMTLIILIICHIKPKRNLLSYSVTQTWNLNLQKNFWLNSGSKLKLNFLQFLKWHYIFCHLSPHSNVKWLLQL